MRLRSVDRCAFGVSLSLHALLFVVPGMAIPDAPPSPVTLRPALLAPLSVTIDVPSPPHPRVAAIATRAPPSPSARHALPASPEESAISAPRHAPVMNTPPQVPPEPPTATTVAAPASTPGDPDVPAGFVSTPAPSYPLAMRDQGIEGVVWVKVQIDKDGLPGEVSLKKSSGYRLLDQAALDAVRQWRFSPALKHAQPVTSLAAFPVNFTLEQ